ncbi:NADH:flavin oxidoreductase/NADH oxidase [Pantoea stewartii subsp. indologenes]|uniref:NADH:flavin oxidoreductase/NADH oxidase n=1 Tax=Pantoea stewartii TaxID=66269 RepID=UPI00197E2B79|nr:NADH:flavin oxidoreductase/NADH oxidase [Pantoea stewartii]MDK2633958.1 NADH:flavin oxidoreductase/NADH oxidase [Pantoea stewartii subsp. indologenes]
MSTLFSTFSLGELTLDNRIVIAPMCQYSAEEGCATAWHRIHLGQLAFSGAGLLIIEATAVEDIGRITYGDLGLWNDETEAALAAVLADIHRYSDMPIGIQLGHAGRKASCDVPWEGGEHISPQNGGWQTVAPSALPFSEGDHPPRAMDASALARVKEAFVATAKRAVRLGLELIEVHAAHGYLLHQFLSPLSNARDDEYGGSLENRMRFPLEVFKAVREAVPAAIPVGVRISASDWVEGGWDVSQSIAFSQQLEALNCAYIHVSSGGLSEQQQISVGPNYQVPFARDIRQQIGIPVIAVGLITEPQQAEDILQQGEADLVALARGMLYNPRWPWHAAAAFDATVKAPPQYLRSEPHGAKGTLTPDE